MKKIKVKKLIKPVVYVGTLSVLFLSIALLEKTTDDETALIQDDYMYVNSSIFTSNIPVVKEEGEATIQKPYV